MLTKYPVFYDIWVSIYVDTFIKYLMLCEIFIIGKHNNNTT